MSGARTEKGYGPPLFFTIVAVLVTIQIEKGGNKKIVDKEKSP